MVYDFDACPDRRPTESEKWRHYPPDVLPLWVADMDFVSAEPIRRALHARVDHGVFGYGGESAELREVLVARLARLYQWAVTPEDIVFLPGVIRGFNLACHAVAAPGGEVVVQTPVYPPFLHAAGHAGLARRDAELCRTPSGRYEVDWDVFEAACSSQTRLFLLCNPHNPVGRVFTAAELTRLAEICQRHGVTICSDEIHCDLVFAGHPHVPIASLAPEIAQHTITLMAPSKTFNIAGLDCSFAIIQNAALRERYLHAHHGLLSGINILAWPAALAAYQEGADWLAQALTYMQANRDRLRQVVAETMPALGVSPVEGTYLAWLDCRALGVANPHTFFLAEARVALNDGATFGPGGEGFVRLNFACPRCILDDALARMKAALARRRSAPPPP